MHSLKVIQEDQFIEVVLFTKVAPRVWQNLCALLSSWVAMLDMGPQLLHVIDSLFSNEDCSARQTNFAECLLVSGLQMASEWLNIREVLSARAIEHQTLHRSQLEACSFSFRVFIINAWVFFVLDCIFRFKFVPSESLVIADYNRLKFSFANAAFIVFHKESDAQHALMANCFVVALAHRKVDDCVEAKNAALLAFACWNIRLNPFSCFIWPFGGSLRPVASASTASSTSTASVHN